MDPLTIGAAVVTILAPYAKDAGTELVKTAGEAGVQKTKDLLHWLKARFAGDPVATSDITRFEKDPTGFASGLKETIDKKAGEDAAFAAEVSRRVKDVAPALTIIQRGDYVKGRVGVDADAINSGSVSVLQESKTSVDETAVRVKTIG